MQSAVALVSATDQGTIVPNAVAILTRNDGTSLTGVSNAQGYIAWANVTLPFSGVLVLTGGAAPYCEVVNIPPVVNPTVRVGQSPANPQDVPLPGCSPFKRPFVAAPRTYEGNMCGTYVAGLPSIPGGAADPTLVVSWLAFLHTPPNRQRIYADHVSKGLKDFLVSWPDFQDAGGTPQGFKAHCLEVLAAGLLPCVMLSAKPTSSADIRDVPGTLANILLVLPLLLGIVPRFCLGWELSLWLSPEDVQWLIDQLYAQILAALAQFFVHFQSGYFAYQPNGQQTGAFWLANVGKLSGILHQRDFASSPDYPSYQARIADCLVRFAGQDNCPSDRGDGTPFVFIALEIVAELAFNDGMSEVDQDGWGQAALSTPPAAGPLGIVPVMGSGNGA